MSSRTLHSTFSRGHVSWAATEAVIIKISDDNEAGGEVVLLLLFTVMYGSSICTLLYGTYYALVSSVAIFRFELANPLRQVRGRACLPSTQQAQSNMLGLCMISTWSGSTPHALHALATAGYRTYSIRLYRLRIDSDKTRRNQTNLRCRRNMG
ncbi:hypothetical protein BZA05DRAFT_29316 [Tricharina praecox]|uniref:uncharacterized protein n=1 Tax=Tricharina praecox TaxID=43433 RepID=UPI00221EA6BD|nr:uncharacterized protein BZA05DRAFT_29316 [Tricharina praecox]KAI5853444.1 hypothetical protein BZA05DRAFT_29316 [Tricharina praecox]